MYRNPFLQTYHLQTGGFNIVESITEYQSDPKFLKFLLKNGYDQQSWNNMKDEDKMKIINSYQQEDEIYIEAMKIADESAKRRHAKRVELGLEEESDEDSEDDPLQICMKNVKALERKNQSLETQLARFKSKFNLPSNAMITQSGDIVLM